ncbi:MAG: hypothetical protein LUD79_04580 [Oscillospiraceae bacterium]|nr:hypothetical protein [Oscillospiraceae bacterium]
MKEKRILNVLGQVDDKYIVEAAPGKHLNGKTVIAPAGRLRRRALFAAALAVVALMGSLTIAMAVNEGFRASVFRFWGIEQTEVVPEFDHDAILAEGGMAVEEQKADIGGVIEGTYLHTPAASIARNGLFFICTDEQMLNAGNHHDAYREEDGTFIKLEEKSFNQDYTILGNDFHVEFSWVEHNGQASYTYVPADADYRKPNLSGTVNATLMSFSCETPEGSLWYPVLIDLETGALTDVLAGTGAENLIGLSNAFISEDLSQMLLACEDGELYYADLNSRQLYSISEISGEQPRSCSLVSDTLLCWVLEGDEIETGAFGTYRIWTIDLNTMQRSNADSAYPATAFTSTDVWSLSYDLYAQTPEVFLELGGQALGPMPRVGLVFLDGFSASSSWGNLYPGSRFAVYVEENQTVRVIDLASGASSIIEGYTWPDKDYPDIECVASPGGDKLLIKECGADGQLEAIGVLDFEKRQYIQFAHENRNDTGEILYWFDNEHIIVHATGDDVSDYCVYEVLDEGA